MRSKILNVKSIQDALYRWYSSILSHLKSCCFEKNAFKDLFPDAVIQKIFHPEKIKFRIDTRLTLRFHRDVYRGKPTHFSARKCKNHYFSY